MKTLNGTDALFLSMETPSWHQHVGGLTLIEPGPGGLTYDDVVAMVVDRIRYAPKFTWKLKTLPLNADRPVWVDDPDFDPRDHVHRIAVPAPGGPREVAQVCGQLVAEQLDRTRPLWEIWFLEGLAGGRVGMFMKYHHSLLDGVAGAALATALLDLEPNPKGALIPLPSEEESRAGGVEIGSLAGTAASRLVRTPAQLTKLGLGLGRLGTHLVAETMRTGNRFSNLGAPRTSVNGPVGPRRNIAFVAVAMQDLKAIRKATGSTVNDVVLAVCGKALADYLTENGEFLDRSLTALMPTSAREADDSAQDNQILATVATLATDIDDPLERLKAISESTKQAKSLSGRMGDFAIPSLGDVFSPLVAGSVLRVAHDLKLLSRQPFRFSTLVSNVVGPPLDLYTCGGKVLGVYPLSVIMETVGTNFTVISNKDRMDFGLHVDADQVDDPWEIVKHIPRAVAELMAASGVGTPTPIEDPFAGPASTSTAASASDASGDDAAEAAPATAPSAKKAAARTSAPRKATPRKTTPRKAAAKKAPAQKAATKKAPATKTAEKPAPAKKTAAKKASTTSTRTKTTPKTAKTGPTKSDTLPADQNSDARHNGVEGSETVD